MDSEHALKKTEDETDFCAEVYRRWQLREEKAEKKSEAEWRRSVIESGDAESGQTQDALELGGERWAPDVRTLWRVNDR